MSQTARPLSCPSGLGFPPRPYHMGGCAGQGRARDGQGVAVVWKPGEGSPGRPGPEPAFPHPRDFRQPICLQILPLNHLPQGGSGDPGQPGATWARPVAETESDGTRAFSRGKSGWRSWRRCGNPRRLWCGRQSPGWRRRCCSGTRSLPGGRGRPGSAARSPCSSSPPARADARPAAGPGAQGGTRGEGGGATRGPEGRVY